MRRETKVDHVMRSTQDRRHFCHWPNCEKQVPPAMWGCKVHWFTLPREIRDRIWDTYRPGQENDMEPSDKYISAVKAALTWALNRPYKPAARALGGKE